MYALKQTLLLALGLILGLVGCGAPTPISPTAVLVPTVVLSPTLVPTQTSAPAPSSSIPSTVAPTRSASEISADIDSFLLKYRNPDKFSGVVLVARNGEVLYEKGFGTASLPRKNPLTATSKFRIASVSKQFTAAAILKLQAEGKLQVQDRVCKYLKACPESWAEITIHHLLTHSSGINADKVPDADNYYTKFHTPAELVSQFQQQPLDFKPGEEFSYGNGGFITLAAIIEQISGETYEEFLRKEFFEPLGMKDTGTTIEDSQLVGEPFAEDLSNDVGAGNLYSTAQDLYRWAQELDKWKQDPKSEFQAMFQPQIGGADCGVGDDYGYGLCVGTRFGQRVVGHFGGSPIYTSALMRYPDSGVTIVILSNTGQEQDPVELGIASIVLGSK